MNRKLLAAAVILAMAVIMIPTIAEENDGMICTITFHDEFYGDYYVYTDYNGEITDHNQFRSWPPVEGYEFKGWFYKNGEQFYTNDHFTRDTTVFAVYEKIGEKNAPSDFGSAIVIGAAIFSVLLLAFSVLYFRT